MPPCSAALRAALIVCALTTAAPVAHGADLPGPGQRATPSSTDWMLAAVTAVSSVTSAVLFLRLRSAQALLAGKKLELDVAAKRDPLTGLYNRRYFERYVKSLAERPARRSAPALLLVDIDRFKQINERHGHQTGDAVLVETARRVVESVRQTDVVFRWSAEEFLVYMPEAPADRLDGIAQRILEAVGRDPVSCRALHVPITVSIGYLPLACQHGTPKLGWDRAVKLADLAVFLAKKNGGNRAYGFGDAAITTPEQDGSIQLRSVTGPARCVA